MSEPVREGVVGLNGSGNAGVRRLLVTVLLLVLTALCAAVLIASQQVGAQVSLAGRAARDESVLNRLQLDALRQHLILNDYWLRGGERGPAQFQSAAEEVTRGLDATLAMDAEGGDGTDDTALVAHLRQVQGQYVGRAQAAIRQSRAGTPPSPTQLAELHDISEELRTELAAVEQEHLAATTEALLAAENNGRLVQVGTPVALSIAAVILTALWLLSRALHRRVREQTLHDALTGLPNRMLFVDRAAQALAAASRSGDVPVLMMIDLDRFKEINDTLGHQAGDSLLVQLAQRLTAATRPQDTVARFGGDEFAVLLSSGGLTVGVQVAERIRQLMEEPFLLDGISVGVEASVGLTAPEGLPTGSLLTEQVDNLLREADTAMYVAKTERCGVSRYAAGSDNAGATEQLSLLGQLRDAFGDDQFVLHYQPKVNAHTGTLTGMEALVRWQHPTRGLLGPDTFIPLAEGTTLIHRLTQTVLDKALTFTREWLDHGVRLPVSVNVSARTLLDREFPARVQEHLNRSGVPAELLGIELTESTIMADPERALAVLAELRTMGVSLSVDDFGTGYSSMAYLKLLPVSELKVDRSFVRFMASDSEDALLVQSAIELGHNLGLTVVAEGVEDAATLAALKDLGADDVQGYFLARPMPEDALRTWVVQHRATQVERTAVDVPS